MYSPSLRLFLFFSLLFLNLKKKKEYYSRIFFFFFLNFLFNLFFFSCPFLSIDVRDVSPRHAADVLVCRDAFPKRRRGTANRRPMFSCRVSFSYLVSFLSRFLLTAADRTQQSSYRSDTDSDTKLHITSAYEMG